MPCYHPITAYRSKQGRDPRTGKWPVVFNVSNGYADLSLTVPCGQCIGCRLEKSRQWATRCVHESTLWKNNCFITCTYRDDQVPRSVNTSTGEILQTLNLSDFQKFMKRLRKEFGPGIRYFQCGEYGETFDRPHHHAILFNFDFSDRKLLFIKNGIRHYRSATLERIWGHGQCTVGNCTFESAAYVARYITKKITGDKANDHYDVRKPEYNTMSRRPGIGQGWLNKNMDEVYTHDQCYIRPGVFSRPPRYYDNKFDLLDPNTFAKIKSQRKLSALRSTDNSPERLAVKERIQYVKFRKLVRTLENSMEV